MQAVIFDLDGTLVDRDAALRGWARARARSEAIEEVLGELPERRSTWLARARRHLPPETTLATLDRELPSFVTRDERVVAAVARLTERVEVAVLTNGKVALQRAKLRAAGLDSLVSRVFVSEALGRRKPDPRCFEIVLDALGARPADTLVVGDREDVDLAPARRLGCMTRWVDPARPVWSAPFEALVSASEPRGTSCTTSAAQPEVGHRGDTR
jgi:putative hydrolase of the HAD superfamily